MIRVGVALTITIRTKEIKLQCNFVEYCTTLQRYFIVYVVYYQGVGVEWTRRMLSRRMALYNARLAQWCHYYSAWDLMTLEVEVNPKT